MSDQKQEQPESSSAVLSGMTGTVAQLLFAVVAAAGVYSFVASAKNGEERRLCTPFCSLRPDYANNNRLAPDFELPTLSGETKKLSDYRGKVVILNFWTKSCRPCLEEMPTLANWAELLKGYPDIELVTVTTDESAEDARTTLASVLNQPAPFTTFIDAENEIVSERFGTKLYPETWYIDKEGIIRARLDGARNWMEPLHLELALAIRGPKSCSVEFRRRSPIGPGEGLCNDVPLAL